MAIQLEYFYLYKLSNKKHLLLKVSRPGYNNANQVQENQAWKILETKQEQLLNHYLTINKTTVIAFIGEFNGLPEGDSLYAKHGKSDMKNIWYIRSSYDNEAIFLSIADSEADFLSISDEEDFADNGMTKQQLIPPAVQLGLTDFITEYDFDLTFIPDAYTPDLESKRLSD